jgi:pyruvate dehydrogenase E2 component (dihydrolipoamide acetyltransferase)
LKAEGEPVTQGEALMVIETDKATVEIEAPSSGILADVSARPGDQVPIGDRIAVILAPAEAARRREFPSLTRERPDGRSRAATDAEGHPSRSGPEQRINREELGGQPVTRHRRIPASPAARRIARERGIDLAACPGSGPEGAILARDLLAGDRDAPARAQASPEPIIRPLSTLRRIVAERMTESKQTAPHFYLSVDVDMSAAVERRAAWPSGGVAPKPSHNDLILHVCARALQDFPALNASFSGNGIRLYRDIHVGFAVALDDGLVVPVIHNADRLTLAELAEQSRQLISKARSKKLVPLDYERGTFTVSNLGMYGIDSFVAIINPPQAAILAAGQIQERVVARSGMFAIRPMLTLTLSADHRAIDGAIGARFLQRIKRDLERAEF